jgi:hypothetical protein
MSILTCAYTRQPRQSCCLQGKHHAFPASPAAVAGETDVVEALRASTIAADKNPLAVRPAASQQSDSAFIGPTGQARLGLADDPRRLWALGFRII